MQAHQRNDDERPHDEQNHTDRIDEHRQDRTGQVPVAQNRQQRQDHDEADRALRGTPRLDVSLKLGGKDGLVIFEGGLYDGAHAGLVGRGRTQQPARSHVTRRQRVRHAGRGVNVRGERRDERHEDNDVHERPDRGDSSHLENGGEGVRLHGLAVPGQQRDQQDHGANVEHEDAGDDRADGAAHGGAGVLGLGGGDRHDLKAAEGCDHRQERDCDTRQAVWRETVVSQDVL